MRNLILLALALIMMGLSGCATSYKPISNEKDLWIEQTVDRSEGTLYYCRANITPDGGSVPVCIEAKRIDLQRTGGR